MTNKFDKPVFFVNPQGPCGPYFRTRGLLMTLHVGNFSQTGLSAVYFQNAGAVYREEKSEQLNVVCDLLLFFRISFQYPPNISVHARLM
jgi:hypothetical protein